MTETIFSHCSYCMCLCGVRISVDNGKVQQIEPDRENPYTWGDFCRKGRTAAEVVDHPQRITTPMRRVGDLWEPATYEEAIADIAQRMRHIIDHYGADAVGSYHGNPLGFSFSSSMFFVGLLDAIGTGNRYWVGSIDQNATHVVQDEMYGSELIALPGDVDDCDCFLLVGMDPAQSKFGWVEVVPNGWNRVLAAQQRGAEIIIVDPRRSTSAERADLHVAILPGQDWIFLLALLKIIFEEGLERPARAVPLSGVEVVRELTRDTDLDDLSQRCGVDVSTLRTVARRFAQAERAMCVTHTGVVHTANGTLGEWLGHVLNAVTDRLDRPGGKRFERSYVDLPKVFSAFAPPSTHRSRLRDLPAIAGFHALAELTDEIITPGPGQIRAMIIAAGNPVVSGPDSRALDAALGQLDLLVAVDIVPRDSHRHAHWLIPGTHWLEREGLHPLFAGVMDAPFAQFSRQAVTPPPGVREEWQFFTELALALKRPLFGKPGANAFVKASRAIARWTGKPGLALNPSWIERLLVMSGRRLKYDEIKRHPHGWRYAQKQYGDLAKALRTADKTVHCAPPRFVAECRRQLAERRGVATPTFPLLLINRRTRESMNSWLNETPSLFQLQRRNAVEMHPDDAAALGLEAGMPVRVRSVTGSIELPVAVVDGGRRGVVTIAHGWGSRIFDRRGGVAQTYGANRNALIDRAGIDPLSQTPAFNATPVAIERIASAPVIARPSPEPIEAVS